MSRILVVDDDSAMCEALSDLLSERGHDVTTKQDALAAFDLLAEEDYDVVVTDIAMRGMNGVELCERIVLNRPDVPVIAISATSDPKAAIALVRAGAFDLLAKPFDPEALLVALERSLEERRLRSYVRRLEVQVGAEAPIESLIGSSRVMAGVRARVRQAASTDASVFITGESGSGKEVVARAIHDSSRRRSRPFVALNCAAISGQLLESELFGHERGAFTDAVTSRAGLFLQANGGTLFLDEIAEMPIELQAKLLRALQERSVRPVGGNRELAFDARVIAATHRDVASFIDRGLFREDLYFRLHVVEIELPPLRERGNDVLELATAFLDRWRRVHGKDVEGFSKEAKARLLAHSWPGNVRELLNAVERAVVMTRGRLIEPDDLPPRLSMQRPSRRPVTEADELVPMAEIERRYILEVMAAVDGNKSHASRILGIDRTTLQRRLEEYGEQRKP